MGTLPTALYGGLAGIKFPFERFELPGGVVLSPTYSHVMAHFLLAFARPTPGKPHPGPWKSANAGLLFDVEGQIHVPDTFHISGWFSTINTIWWTAALIRIRVSPLVRLPVISSLAFSEIPAVQTEPSLLLMEVQDRHLFGPGRGCATLDVAHVEWLERIWPAGGSLFREHPNFGSAVVAFDQSVWSASYGLGLVTLWGAFELLFVSSRHRKTFQLASRVSAFLEPPGDARLALSREVVGLYEARSDAAHGQRLDQDDAFFQSHALLKRVIVKMLESNFVPSLADLEHLSQPGAEVSVH